MPESDRCSAADPLPVVHPLAREDPFAALLDARAPGGRLFRLAEMERIAALATGCQDLEGGLQFRVFLQRRNQFFRVIDIVLRQFDPGTRLFQFDRLADIRLSMTASIR